MLKKILIVILIICFSLTFLSSFQNPFWDKNNKLFYKIHKFIPNSIILNFSDSIDKTKGITPFGILYEYTAMANIQDSLFFTTQLCLGENIPKLKTIDTGVYYRPLKFLAFDLDYKFRNFTEYKTGEHDLIIKMYLIFNIIKYFSLNIDSGFNLRFVDLNIYDYKTVYKKDWLFNASFKWKITLMFHPMYIFSAGISLGNIPEYDIYSFNYLQVEFINYVHLKKDFSIFVNGGFGWAGSLPMAGIINKGWIRFGVRYEIKTY